MERAGFALTLRNEAPADTTVVVDADCAAQIFINLVDNALKFSAGAAGRSRRDRGAPRERRQLLFTVRDYGPGCARPR